MTSAKKRLIISIAALMVALAIATGTTFAWFTINKEVNLAEMDVSVTSGSQGLYVSTSKDGIYKTSLDLADLQAAGYNANAKLDAITSPDGVVMNEVQKADATGPAPVIDKSSNKFIEFTLYFRASGDDKPVINLYREGAAKVGKETKLEPAAVNTGLAFYNEYGAITEGQFGKNPAVADKADFTTVRAAHSARASFVVKTYDKDNDYSAVAPASTRIWDPYQDGAGTFCGTPANFNKTDAENFAYQYYNKIMVENSGDASAAIKAPSKVTLPSTQDTATFQKDVLDFTFNDVSHFWECQLTVRLWIEGYDGDCINRALGDKILADFLFIIEEPAV